MTFLIISKFKITASAQGSSRPLSPTCHVERDDVALEGRDGLAPEDRPGPGHSPLPLVSVWLWCSHQDPGCQEQVFVKLSVKLNKVKCKTE